MNFIQNERSKNFVRQVKTLVDSGAVGSLTEIVEEIDWNRSAMSQALNGSRNVPPEVIARFTNSYKENEAIESGAKNDTLEKYVRQLEKNNAILEKNLEQMEVRLKAVDKAFEQIEIIKSFMNRFEKNQKEIVVNLGEIAENQFLFGAVQQGWQEYWSEHLKGAPATPLHEVKEMIRIKVASLLHLYSDKGKEAVLNQDN